MSLMDALFKTIPDYEADNDPLAKPGEDEKGDLGLHVNLCAVRYSDLKQGHVQITQQLQMQQKLLMILIAILLLNKVIDISMITGFFK